MEQQTSINNDQTGIAARVKELLKDKNLKDMDGAAAAGVTRPAFCKWMQNDRIPYLEHRTKLAKFLDVSVQYLETGIDQPVAKQSFPVIRTKDELVLNVTANRSSIVMPVLRDLANDRLSKQDSLQYSALEQSMFNMPDSPSGCFAIEMNSDVFEPDIPMGSQVLIDHRKLPEPGSLVYVLMGERTELRRWMPVANIQMLTFTNPLYRDSTAFNHNGDIMEIWLGTAVGVARKLV